LDISHVLSIHKNQHEAVLPNALQNGSSSTREAAPQEKPEPELFLVEPEPCQTGPTSLRAGCALPLLHLEWFIRLEKGMLEARLVLKNFHALQYLAMFDH